MVEEHDVVRTICSQESEFCYSIVISGRAPLTFRAQQGGAWLVNYPRQAPLTFRAQQGGGEDLAR